MIKIFNYKLFALSVVFCLFASSVYSQQASDGDKKAALFSLSNQNYRTALNQFLLLLKKDSLNAENLMLTGLCYLNSNIDKTKAIYYYEKASKLPKFDKAALFDLGKAYMYAFRFEDAIKTFEKYIASGLKDDNPVKASRMIEMCKEAPEMMKKPLKVDLDLLDEKINSAYPDYNPYITPDESSLIFTSKRSGNTGNYPDFDGFFTADIYYSNFTNNAWTKAKKYGMGVNTNLAEECTGYSVDGNDIVFWADNEMGTNDIFITRKIGKNFKKAESFGPNVNQPQSFETAGALSPDKTMLYFSSNRAGGKGGKDLYVSKLLPGGEWSAAENLGDEINTVYDEDFPYISPDGCRLYFASTGHEGMGGYDIFVSNIDTVEKTFSPPVNLGYPLNTVFDDMTISYTSSGRHAYISRFFPDGFGEKDIYRVTFKNIAAKPVIYKGQVFTADSVNVCSIYNNELLKLNTQIEVAKKLVAAFVSAMDSLKSKKSYQSDSAYILLQKQLQTAQATAQNYIKTSKTQIIVRDSTTKEVKGTYTPNTLNGFFSMILMPGNYTLEIKNPALPDFNMPLLVNDYEFMDEVIPLKIYLNPNKEIQKSKTKPPITKNKKIK
ncbi:MAG: hypothetical protein WCH34_05685 [Bacteroidota bacterium]